MTDWHVVPSNPGGDGSEANPWDNTSSINWTSVQPGDDVVIRGGCASFQVGRSGAAGLPVTIRGDYPGEPGSIVGDASGLNAGIFQNGRDYITVRDITVDVTSATQQILFRDSNNCEYKKVTLGGSTTHGFLFASISSSNCANVTIDGLVVTGGLTNGIHWFPASADNAGTLTDIVIRNCDIQGCAQHGVYMEQGSSVSASCLITRMTIEHNVLSANGKEGLRLLRQQAVSGHNLDLVIAHNEVNGNGTDDSLTECGGIKVRGFISSTGDYGRNKIHSNTASGNQGQTGGLNLLNSAHFEVYANTFSDLTLNGTTQTIDGIGVLVEVSNNVKVFQNSFRNITSFESGYPAASFFNSAAMGTGAGPNDQLHFFSNVASNCRSGFYFGPNTTTTNCEVVGNIFDGVYNVGVCGGSNTDLSTGIVKNNIFVAASEAHNDTGTIVGKWMTDASSRFPDEDFNDFYGFDSDFTNDPLGAKTVGVNPVLDANHYPHNRALIAAGIRIPGVEFGYDGVGFQPEPTIGAFEMFRRRAVLVAARGSQIVRQR